MSETTVTLNVEGMSCNHCLMSVTNAVNKLDGISSVNVDLKGKTVSVSYKADKVGVDAIKTAIEDQGFDVV